MILKQQSCTCCVSLLSARLKDVGEIEHINQWLVWYINDDKVNLSRLELVMLISIKTRHQFRVLLMSTLNKTFAPDVVLIKTYSA